MEYFSEQITNLISELSKLPGVGKKSAQRLAFHIIEMPEDKVEDLAKMLVGAKKNTHYCQKCLCLTDKELCPVCSDSHRDPNTIMVVENTQDMAAYERVGQYQGVYHVLHGAISPTLYIGPNDIRLKELIARLDDNVKEVIIATNSSLEGEATAMLVKNWVSAASGGRIPVSRIASGVPVGGDLEYIDEITLLRALEGRREI